MIRSDSIKKLQIVLLVLIVAFVVAISGCTSETNNTTSNTTTNTSDSNTTSNSTSGDVSIAVSYDGVWAVDVSGPFGYRSISGEGDKTTNIGSVEVPVTASARKTEGDDKVLTVSIIKDGRTIASQSTSDPYGGATAVVTGF